MRPLLAALVLLVSAQIQGPPRDAAPAAAPKPGTGIIRGRVVAADTGVPIRRALVTISSGGPGRGAPQTIYTDARGRYEVRDLLPGSYLLTARPNQYQGQYLPSVTPPSPSTDGPPRVTLVDGQTLEGYDLALPRAGVIVGRLVDENGDPVSGLSARVLRPGDRSEVGNYQTQASDESGRFRIFHLTPGDYQIVVKPFGGGDWLQPGQNGQSLGFVDTYYPGTISREEAGRLRVRAGQETAAGDLQLTRTRMLRVSGTVFDSQGAPAGSRTMLMFAKDGGSIGMGVGAQGRFSISQPQPPGTYRVIARLADESGETTLEYGSVAITLADADADDVTISMKPTINVAGRVVFEPAAPPVLPTELGISAQQKDSSANPQLFIRAAAVAADLTFTLRRIAGEWLLRPSGRGSSGWALKAVMLGSTDITDVPTEFRAEDSGRLQVIFTNRASELAGTVTNDKGDPVQNATIVLLSEDKADWFGSSSRFRTTRPGRDGHYAFKGLRPGRYYLIAVPPERRVDGQSVDAALLGSLVREATALVLGDDEQRVVDLKLASKEGGL